MRSLKNNIIDLYNLLESKDHLIDRLNLTPEQKEELKAFFKSHPNFENKIDWNRKDLTWDDFQEVLALEGATKSSQKKYGISGKAQIKDLVEGKDYEIIEQNDDYIAYYVKTFKGSEVLAKPTTPPLGVTGRWCIAGKNYSPGTRDDHWNNYISEGYKFIFVFTKKTKYALSCIDEKIDCFDCADHKIECPEKYKQLDDYLLTDEQKFWKNLRKKDKVVIPEGITSIPKNAFADSFVKKVIIPDFVTSIGSNAFYDCIDLTNITISRSVINIGDSAFGGCEALKSITIPDSVTSIGDYTFSGCKALKSITIPDSVTSIGNRAFHGCSNLTNITIPDSVTSIGEGVFHGCSGLTSITIPDSVTSIGDYTFSACLGLKSVTIGSSVTSIERATFYGCSGLTNVVIGKSVTNIDYWVFRGCKNLTDIVFSGTKSQWNMINKDVSHISKLPWNYEVPATVVHCSDGDVELTEE